MARFMTSYPLSEWAPSIPEGRLVAVQSGRRSPRGEQLGVGMCVREIVWLGEVSGVSWGWCWLGCWSLLADFLCVCVTLHANCRYTQTGTPWDTQNFSGLFWISPPQRLHFLCLCPWCPYVTVSVLLFLVSASYFCSFSHLFSCLADILSLIMCLKYHTWIYI